MGKGTVGNWLGEICTTVGQGDLELGGKIDESLTEFSTVLANGDEVWYALVDGNNREAGLGTLNNGVLERTYVYSVLSAGVYMDNAPAPLELTGGARVYSTFNKQAFDDAINNTQNFTSETYPPEAEAKEGDTWTKTSTRQVFTLTNTGTQLHWIESSRGIVTATAPPYIVPNSGEVANDTALPGTYVSDVLIDHNTRINTAQSTANNALSVANSKVSSVNAGTNVTITGTAANPVVNAAASGGQVDTLVAGANITIDATDPVNPTIHASGTGLGHGSNTVTEHNDVTSAGSGAIITASERADINNSITSHDDVTLSIPTGRASGSFLKWTGSVYSEDIGHVTQTVVNTAGIMSTTATSYEDMPAPFDGNLTDGIVVPAGQAGNYLILFNCMFQHTNDNRDASFSLIIDGTHEFYTGGQLNLHKKDRNVQACMHHVKYLNPADTVGVVWHTDNNTLYANHARLSIIRLQ